VVPRNCARRQCSLRSSIQRTCAAFASQPARQTSSAAESPCDQIRHRYLTIRCDPPLLDITDNGRPLRRLRHLRAGYRRELVEAIYRGRDHAAPFLATCTAARRFSRVTLDRRIEACVISTSPPLSRRRCPPNARGPSADFRIARRQHGVVDRGKLPRGPASPSGGYLRSARVCGHAHATELADLAHLAGRENRLFGNLDAGAADTARIGLIPVTPRRKDTSR